MTITPTILLLLVLAAGGDAITQLRTPASVAAKDQPVIQFGHEGGSLRPFTIALYEDGRVEATKGAPPLKTNSISPDKVKELIAKASSKSFWKKSHIEERPTVPDFGFVFVKARSASGKIINHHGAKSGRLGEFYSELSDLVLKEP